MASKQITGGSRRRSGCLIAVAIFFGIGLVGAIVGGAFEPKPEESALDKAERARENGDLATLYVAHQAIQRILKDPDSADFSDGVGRLKHGEKVACGKVNGKNSFGALTGAQRWLVIVDQNVALIRAYNNQPKFVHLWNKYCTGLDDRDKPMPAELLGIRLGSRRPSTLKLFEGNGDVLVYVSAKPHDYLGVPIADAWFEADHDRITGGSVSTRGGAAYEHWRDELTSRYGHPSSVGTGDQPVLEWEWGRSYPIAQLSYGSATNQTLFSIRIGHR